MRKYFINKKDVHRIDLSDGQWIDIMAMCSYGIRKKAISAMMRPSATSSNRDVRVNMDFDAGAFNDVLLKEMIVDWSFTDESGNKVPLTPENIDNLAADIAQIVVEEIGRLNPQRSEEEKNAL